MKHRITIFRLVAGLSFTTTMLAALMTAPFHPAVAQMDTPVPTQNSNSLFSMSASNPSVKAGDTFDLNINIQTDTETRGAQAALVFDPALVEVVDVVEGDFYKSFADTIGASTMMVPSKPKVDNEKGTVQGVGVVIMGGSTSGPMGAKGNGVFVTYHLKAKGNGQAKFSLQLVKLYDAAFGKNQAMGGVNTQDLVLAIGGGAVEQPTAHAGQPTSNAPVSTAVRRATSTPEAVTDNGNAGFPWLIVVPVAGLFLVGGVVLVTRKK
jgi:hypothetical protein